MQSVSRSEQFDPGDIVYARFFGNKAFVVKGVAKTHSPFPHYFCESEGDIYLIPMIRLSTRDFLPLVEDGNRLQLELPMAPS
jgi:hypothetical protein